MTKAITTVCVTLEDREDGGLRVSSTDLPGLILSGTDKQAVFNKIAPAITAIFKAAQGLDVKVSATKPIQEILDGQNPQTVDINVHKAEESISRASSHVRHKVFVVELPQAA